MGNRRSAELKALEGRRDKLKTQLKQTNIEINDLEKNKKDLKTKISSLESKIEKIKSESKEVVVSEHAILRYLENVKGVDIETIEKEIISEKDKETVKTLGGTCNYKKSGFELKIKNGTVTTIIN